MEDVDAIIVEARRAFSKRRNEIGTTVEPHLRPMAMRDQILKEMAIVRQLLRLMVTSGSGASLRSSGG